MVKAMIGWVLVKMPAARSEESAAGLRILSGTDDRMNIVPYGEVISDGGPLPFKGDWAMDSQNPLRRHAPMRRVFDLASGQSNGQDVGNLEGLSVFFDWGEAEQEPLIIDGLAAIRRNAVLAIDRGDRLEAMNGGVLLRLIEEKRAGIAQDSTHGDGDYLRLRKMARKGVVVSAARGTRDRDAPMKPYGEDLKDGSVVHFDSGKCWPLTRPTLKQEKHHEGVFFVSKRHIFALDELQVV